MKELLMSEERCMQLMELIQPFEDIMAGAPKEMSPYDLWVYLQHAFYQKFEHVSPIEMRALFSMAIARHAVESMIEKDGGAGILDKLNAAVENMNAASAEMERVAKEGAQ